MNILFNTFKWITSNFSPNIIARSKFCAVFFWLVLLTLLTACGPVPTEQPITPTATSASAFTALPQTPTASPTETPSPTPTPLPLFPLDGYVTVFKQENDLYFQDGDNEPILLTYGGEETHFIAISDDNKKIVFARGEYPYNRYSIIYSINSDGTDERELITTHWLDALGEGIKVRSPVFVPDAHKLLFNTYLCKPTDNKPSCSTGLFLVDTDTEKTKNFLPPSEANQDDRDSNFKISPDGKMVAVAMLGHIDLFDLDGKILHENILPYLPNTTYNLFPEQFWLPDSNGLIVALPNTTYHSVAYGDLPAYSIWRYSLDDDLAVQIPLDPSPMTFTGDADKFQASPDGKWIIYGGSSQYDSELYIGNLTDGHTKVFDNQVYPYFSWSPDSKHFIYGRSLGAIDGVSIHLSADYRALGKWIDASHYVYIADENNTPKPRIGIIDGGNIQTYEFGIDTDIEASIFIKPK